MAATTLAALLTCHSKIERLPRSIERWYRSGNCLHHRWHLVIGHNGDMVGHRLQHIEDLRLGIRSDTRECDRVADVDIVIECRAVVAERMIGMP